jgi:hypothetical protein
LPHGFARVTGASPRPSRATRPPSRPPARHAPTLPPARPPAPFCRYQVIKRVAEKGELASVALNTHGTRAVQKLIETLTSREQRELVIAALAPGVVPLIKVRSTGVAQGPGQLPGAPRGLLTPGP